MPSNPYCLNFLKPVFHGPFMTSPLSKSGQPLSSRGRVMLGLGSLALLSGFCVAAWIQPDPRGFGTHHQLGLPPCNFLDLTGFACPACGMTTSFSHFVRGHWMQSARCSLTGFTLAGVCATGVLWSWLSLWTKRLCFVQRPDRAALIVMGVLYTVGLGEWVSRILSQ